MILRSGFMYNEFPTIDFDYASYCWRLNKEKIGTEGMFRYL
jgi:hypothetical protein